MSLFEKNNKYFISDSAYVFKAHINKDEAFAKHKHDFVEMVYIIKGNCTHTIDGRNYSAKSGDLVIINYNQTHRISGAEETTYVNILLKPEYISRNLVNQENAFALLHLVEFEDLIFISKCHSQAKRYPAIKNWFLDKYPEVKKFGITNEENKVTDLPATTQEFKKAS